MRGDDDLALLEQEALVRLEAIPLEEFEQARLYEKFRGKDQHRSARPLPNAGRALEALRDYRGGNRWAALNWAGDFVKEFLGEIRKLLCPEPSTQRSKAKRSGVRGASARAAVSAIASWLASVFSIANPFAVALATFIVAVIGSAALAAFCTTTNGEVLSQLHGSAA